MQDMVTGSREPPAGPIQPCAPPTLGRASPRVAVIGNCQSRVLAELIGTMCPEASVLDAVIVHLARDGEAERTLERISGADVVLAQLVADDYPVRHVRTSALRAAVGDRMVTWLNLYHRGRNPELCYQRRLEGQGPFPLEAYHIETVLDGFVGGLDAAEILRRAACPDWNAERYRGVGAASLAELRRREAASDVPIVDWIAEREAHADLFHTFNHPARALLVEYAHRILEAAGIAPRFDIGSAVGPEPLGRISPPSNPAAPGPRWRRRTYRLPGDGPPSGVLGRARLVDESEIVDGFLRAYERIAARGGAAADALLGSATPPGAVSAA